MTFYESLGVSGCEVAGAVALCAIHDLRVNLFSFSGFPQISVSDLKNGVFKVTLSVGAHSEHSYEFSLSKEEAATAAKKFKVGNEHDKKLFEVVQKGLAAVERQYLDRHK
jgi:hypothetical protein